MLVVAVVATLAAGGGALGMIMATRKTAQPPAAVSLPPPVVTTAPLVSTAPTASPPEPPATIRLSAQAPRMQYSGTDVIVSGTDFTGTPDGFDYQGYTTRLGAAPFAPCFAAAIHDPPLHEYTDYVVAAKGNTYVSITGKGSGLPKLDACVAKVVRTIPIAGAPDVASSFTFSLAARCPRGACQ